MAEPKTHGTKRAPAARWRGRKQIAGDRNQRFFAQAMRAHEGIVCAAARRHCCGRLLGDGAFRGGLASEAMQWWRGYCCKRNGEAG